MVDTLGASHAGKVAVCVSGRHARKDWYGTWEPPPSILGVVSGGGPGPVVRFVLHSKYLKRRCDFWFWKSKNWKSCETRFSKVPRQSFLYVNLKIRLLRSGPDVNSGSVSVCRRFPFVGRNVGGQLDGLNLKSQIPHRSGGNKIHGYARGSRMAFGGRRLTRFSSEVAGHLKSSKIEAWSF